MTYVITEPCKGVKSAECVNVCPVDAIHPRPDEPDFEKVDMLYINPDECIECGACASVCPVDAIFHEADLPEEYQEYIEINAKYFQ
ncbi:MAG: 4Fe-4S dicluster domain-containing protein [Thermotogae bacterium]|nr:4Fe-4S dicluster domain-containing protein [Thermotogota bacterium]